MTPELVVRDVCGVVRGPEVGAVVNFTVRGGGETRSGATLRWDTTPGWERLLEGLGFLNPAERFTLGGLGADGELAALPACYKGHGLSVCDARRLLRRRLLEKPLTREQFEKMDVWRRLPKTFDERSLFDVEDGRWLTAMRTKKPRGPKRIIY